MEKAYAYIVKKGSCYDDFEVDIEHHYREEVCKVFTTSEKAEDYIRNEVNALIFCGLTARKVTPVDEFEVGKKIIYADDSDYRHLSYSYFICEEVKAE